MAVEIRVRVLLHHPPRELLGGLALGGFPFDLPAAVLFPRLRRGVGEPTCRPAPRPIPIPRNDPSSSARGDTLALAPRVAREVVRVRGRRGRRARAAPGRGRRARPGSALGEGTRAGRAGWFGARGRGRLGLSFAGSRGGGVGVGGGGGRDGGLERARSLLQFQPLEHEFVARDAFLRGMRPKGRRARARVGERRVSRWERGERRTSRSRS